MKKRIGSMVVCFVLILFVVASTACNNETEILTARINSLEDENAELRSTISSLRDDFDRSQANLFGTRDELQELQTLYDELLEAFEADDNLIGPLAITYRGVPNPDMTWPYMADLEVGLRINLNEFDEGVEIIWRSTNEDIFTVTSDEDGLTAIVTPKIDGSAELVVTVGDQETRSWVRIKTT